MKKDILVYGLGGGYCSYCDSAKDLLEDKDLDYEFIDITDSEDFQTQFVSKGFRSVPQITIKGEHIGGYDDLVIYFEKGNTDATD